MLATLFGLLAALLGAIFLFAYLLDAGKGSLALALVFFALGYLGLSGGGYPPPRG
ncbi:MAG: hypothetical protein M5U01_31670 [Ardenticatenaceae bacterium]|nr:hypothetical protein [Ardenticatenaceae bacterium]